MEPDHRLDARIDDYVDHVQETGDPFEPGHPLEDTAHDITVGWYVDDAKNTYLKLYVDGTEYGYFFNGKRADPPREGGVHCAEVSEWDAFRAL